jgi:cystathionine beta-lyase/cystathionine gamma-synthase
MTSKYLLGRHRGPVILFTVPTIWATEDLEKIKTFFNSLQLFQIGVSWGGHESLIYAPAISYLKELSPEKFVAMGISLGDMRISVGLENTDDLIQDLETALEKI